MHFRSDLSRNDLLTFLHDSARELRERNTYQLYFCVLMSHGYQDNMVVCSDGNSISLNEILHIFRDTGDKPKAQNTLLSYYL